MILKFVIQRKSSAEMGERHGKKFSGRAARNAFCKSIYYVGADYGNAFVYVRVPDAQDRDGRKDAGDRFGSGGCPRGICGGLYLGKKSGKQKFLWGLIFGIIYFLVYLVISFLISGMSLTIPGVVKSFAIMAAGGMIGGMVS